MIKLSKVQIKKIIQSGGFLGKLLSKLAGPLMKVALPLAKNVLAPLGLAASMSAIDGSIQKKIHGSGVKLIIEQEDMNDIMKIIEALENSGILLKGVSKTIKRCLNLRSRRWLKPNIKFIPNGYFFFCNPLPVLRPSGFSNFLKTLDFIQFFLSVCHFGPILNQITTLFFLVLNHFLKKFDCF